MSNLDKSLDEMLAIRNKGGRRTQAKESTGGIRKRSSRAAAVKANEANKAINAPKTPTSTPEGSKIIVSNLPYDVSEQMIKEYFTKVVGPVKKIILSYGPDGRSRGIATIIFVNPAHGKKAYEQYNGVLVDTRPMKVEVVVDPHKPLSLADRVGPVNKSKPAPKAPAPKPKAAAPRSRPAKRGGKKSAPRPKKTQEELDSEMADYFGGDNQTAAGSAPAASNAAPTNADAMVEDEVL